MISPEKIAEMLAAAEKATPGEWGEGDKWVFASPRSGNPTHALEHIFRNEEAQENAAYVALANPQAITEILSELLTLRTERDEGDIDHPTPSEAAANLREYARKRVRAGTCMPGDNNFEDAASVIDRLVSRAEAAEAQLDEMRKAMGAKS